MKISLMRVWQNRFFDHPPKRSLSRESCANWPNDSQIRTLGKPNGTLNSTGTSAEIVKTIARQRDASAQSKRSDAATRLSEMAIPKSRAAKTANSHLFVDSFSVVDLTRARIPPTIARVITLSKCAAPAKL